MNNWRRIIWREWRHCFDPVYAQHLFELVADEPVGWGAKASVVVLNTVGGAAIALVCGAILTFDWRILQHFAWAGGLIGGLRGYMFSQGLTWRGWLSRLSASTPTSDLSRVIFSGLMLGLLGGMIFGPVFWLLAVGLFWAFGELMVWMNRSLTESLESNLADRRWWFWWRGRPYLAEVETALRQACTALPAGAVWPEALRHLATKQSEPAAPKVLLADLGSEDWIERFVARYRLVRLGQAAIPALQSLAEKDTSPLQQTALWLIFNIEHAPAPLVTDPKGFKNL
jgi:hypothetical protein